MYKNIFKSLFVTIIIGVVVIALGSLFFSVLPYIIVIGVAIWLIFYITMKIKLIKNNFTKKSDSYEDSNDYSTSEAPEDIDLGNVIDVDYKEIDKK